MQRKICADGSREFLAALLHLGRAFDWHHAMLQSVLIVAFVIWRGDFCARSDGPSVRWAFLIGGSAFCVLAAFGLIALPHFEGEITGSQDFGARLRAVLDLIFLQSTETLSPSSDRAGRLLSSSLHGMAAIPSMTLPRCLTSFTIFTELRTGNV